jgi:hypothetical protein
MAAVVPNWPEALQKTDFLSSHRLVHDEQFRRCEVTFCPN